MGIERCGVLMRFAAIARVAPRSGPQSAAADAARIGVRYPPSQVRATMQHLAAVDRRVGYAARTSPGRYPICFRSAN
jgi:hypothetical protein